MNHIEPPLMLKSNEVFMKRDSYSYFECRYICKFKFPIDNVSLMSGLGLDETSSTPLIATF